MCPSSASKRPAATRAAASIPTTSAAAASARAKRRRARALPDPRTAIAPRCSISSWEKRSNPLLAGAFLALAVLLLVLRQLLLVFLAHALVLGLHPVALGDEVLRLQVGLGRPAPHPEIAGVAN